MNNYLLQLLKEVKTIIIPGLGAITLTNEHTGEMMFMSYLKFDDGNLAKHIAEKEGMDINDAKNLIAKFVREVTTQLDKGDNYDMYQFGTFKKIDGEIAFDQWEAGSATSATIVIPETTAVSREKTPEVPSEETNLREETPASESENTVIPIITPIVDEEKPVIQEIPVPEREDVNPGIVSESTKEAPIIELTDSGFDTATTPPPVVEKPEIIHESPQPKNDVPPITKHDPGVAASPKETLEAKDNIFQKPTTVQPKKKKKSVLSYILWGIVVMILGGGTYVFLNYNTLKKDFPILADFAGDSGIDTAKMVKPITDSLFTEEDPVTVEDTASTVTEQEVPVPEVTPEKAPPPPPPIVVEKSVVVKTSRPKPPRKRQSRPESTGVSTVSIGKPDPAKPFHVIGGSFGAESNAKRYASELIAKGQPSVLVGEFQGMYRVSVASFATKEEALQANTSLKSIAPQSWVFQWP